MMQTSVCFLKDLTYLCTAAPFSLGKVQFQTPHLRVEGLNWSRNGSEACEAYGLREAAEAREALRSQGAKECPQCKTQILKHDGCNHMVCIACQCHWCWTCGKDVGGRLNLGWHYNPANPTGCMQFSALEKNLSRFTLLARVIALPGALLGFVIFWSTLPLWLVCGLGGLLSVLLLLFVGCAWCSTTAPCVCALCCCGMTDAQAELILCAPCHSCWASAKSEIRNFKAGVNGARVGFLTKEGLLSALKELGLAAIGNAEEASDLTRKLIVAKKVHIFRHLSSEQITKLVQSFVLQRYRKGAHVIKQGTMTKNSYFGERALLFDEPRTATVEVSSPEAELWSIEKSTFSSIVKGKMQQELMHRIRLQDTDFTMKDCQIGLMGLESGTPFPQVASPKSDRWRYALKRVRKNQGKIPVEVKRECELLKAQEHPFIMRLVQTFETHKSVYILTELITGGELHGAIREIPTVLSRAQAQFYTGCLIIVLEELSEKNIVYRDAWLMELGIGTPHYMAPEIMRGHGYGTEVDLWSLGIILFEFVCGYLPFADELDDPTEVCTAVLKDPLEFHSRFKDLGDAQCKAVIQGMLNRQPKKRLGAGMNGWEDIRTAENSEFFLIGHSGSTLFDKIMGRELEAPVMPKGEKYCEPTDIDFTLSDEGELG
eukprot:g8944.t1